MTDEIDCIIAGLSGAQRKVMDCTSPLLSRRSYGQIRAALRRKGVFAYIGLTPLGLAVRARLMGEG